MRQQSDLRRRQTGYGLRMSPRRTVCACAVLASAATAQPATAPIRGWSVEPSVFLSLTGTDNYRLQPVRESDTITEAGAGLRVVGTGGRVRGFFDYALSGIAYARNSQANDVRHRLTAFGTAEVVDGFAFVEAQASYARQAVSAFGVQAARSSLDAVNQTDTASISVIPRVRGRFAPTVRYEGRTAFVSTRAKDTRDGDVDTISAQFTVDGGGEGTAVGWRARALHDVSDYRAGRRTFDTRLLAGVSYAVSYDLRVGATAGVERTDLRVGQGETTNTTGLEAEWRPTERTLVSANVERRFFGTGHSLQLSHRTPRSVWTLSDSRDISTTGAAGATAFGTNYDLAFNSSEFAAERDLVQRDLKVREALRKAGLDPNAAPVGGFLAAAATLTRTQAASVALTGVRNTVTFRAMRSRTQRADELATVDDDLSESSSVRQRGLSLDMTHRLTPTSVIGLTGAYQRSQGDVDSQETTLKSIALRWSMPLGVRSALSVGARHARFDGATQPYKESALFGVIRHAF